MWNMLNKFGIALAALMLIGSAPALAQNKVVEPPAPNGTVADMKLTLRSSYE